MDTEGDIREQIRRPGSIGVVAVGRARPEVLVPADSDRIPLADGGVSVLVTTFGDRGPVVSS